jgi:hypothetical protein
VVAVQVGEGADPAHRNPPTAQGVGLGDLAGGHILLKVPPTYAVVCPLTTFLTRVLSSRDQFAEVRCVRCYDHIKSNSLTR